MESTEERIDKLEIELSKLREGLLSHNKVFRIMATKLQRYESNELKSVSNEMRDITPEPVLGKVINLHNRKRT